MGSPAAFSLAAVSYHPNMSEGRAVKGQCPERDRVDPYLA